MTLGKRVKQTIILPLVIWEAYLPESEVNSIEETEKEEMTIMFDFFTRKYFLI